MNEEKILAVLNRIATALEVLASARTSSPAQAMQKSPNFKRKLQEYPSFDWASIQARVVSSDKHGAKGVMWAGREFHRRTHETFDEGIWFSVFREKVGEKRFYDRLISFEPKVTIKKLPKATKKKLSPPGPASAPSAKPTRPSPTPPPPPPPAFTVDGKAALDALFPR